jgi:hypothetical protein
MCSWPLFGDVHTRPRAHQHASGRIICNLFIVLNEMQPNAMAACMSLIQWGICPPLFGFDIVVTSARCAHAHTRRWESFDEGVFRVQRCADMHTRHTRRT